MSRLGIRAVAALVVTSVAACSQSPKPMALQESDAPVPLVVSNDPICAESVRLIVNPLVARPGATLKIFSDHPLGYAPPIDIPDDLLTGWRVTPSGAATVAADGVTVAVSEQARPGSVITLSAMFCGKTPVSKTVPVAGRDEPVIVGFWKQDSADCSETAPPHDPVRELSFEADGGFSLTYMPFESYTDFWGVHTFDPVTGDLSMTVTGGNRKPVAADLSGRARLEGEKRLVLEDFYLGTGGLTPDASCNYVFLK